MKKYLSIGMLYARSSIFKILMLFLLLATGQFLLFHRQLMQNISTLEPFRIGFYAIINDSKISWLFLVGMLLLTIILSLNLWSGKGKSIYTIYRLSVKEQTLFLIQAVYNSCCYLLLILFELFVLILCYRHLSTVAPELTRSNQDLFLNFYANDFLHSLLPLEDIPRLIRNSVLVFTLGFGSAYQSFLVRRKKPAIILFILCMLHLLTFVSPLGTIHSDIAVSFISGYFIFYMCYMVYRKEAFYEL